MRKLKIVISVLASFSFVVQLPVWASWAQVDHATKDEMLRRMTDEGSSKFLSGTIGVQEAFQKFDDRNREEAVAIGIKAATDFDEARARFEAARDRVKEHSELRDELNSRLSLRSYDERGLSHPPCLRLTLSDYGVPPSSSQRTEVRPRYLIQRPALGG